MLSENKIDFEPSQSPEILAAELDKVVALPKLLAQQLTISHLLTSLTPQKDLTNILIGLYDINKHGLTSSKKEWDDDDIQNGPRILTLLARMFFFCLLM